MFTLLGREPRTAELVCFQGIVALGLGLISSTALPAIIAPLSEANVATATGTWAFLRSISIIWGISIPGAVFNNRFTELTTSISDPATRALLLNGGAYEHATNSFVDSFPDRPVLQAQIIAGYTKSSQRVWQVAFIKYIYKILFIFDFWEKKHCTED